MKISKEQVLSALSAWMTATEAYSECERGLAPQPIARAALALVWAIDQYGADYRPRRVTKVHWSHVVTTIGNVIQAVSLRFIGDEFGDDDTDAPCDVEWDVHSLIHTVDQTHEIPGEIEPSHVVGTVFPHESDEE